jgi:hypothetical protein
LDFLYRLLQGVTHEIYHILRGVDAPQVFYYGELKLPVSFTTGSHFYFRGVDHENIEDSPGLSRENLAKTYLRMCSTSKEDKFE